MKKRLNYDYVKSFFESNGYKLLSNEYTNAKTHLNAQCNKGHLVKTTWDAFRSGRRCAKCSKRSVTIDEVKEYTQSIGYVLLSLKYQNAKKKLQFKCFEGHTFSMSWDNFKNNKRRCPECQKLRRWTYDEVKAYFKEHGFILLSNKYQNVNQKLNYRCPEGHEGSTTFNKFKNAQHGCDYCGGSRRLELEFIKKEFTKEGLELLEKEYHNAGVPLKFKCLCGNIDTVTYRRFKWASSERKNPKRKCRECMIPDWHFTINEEERIKSRKYPEYYEWVKLVKERDGFTCDCCGYYGKDVVAHHLEGYSWCKEKRTDVNNGVTMCQNCHNNFHFLNDFKENTKNQYLEFWFNLRYKNVE